ncbi:beta strand repeat-containing protein [Mucilaginibacter xinganensis]|uniref:Serine/threonine-protein kinase PknD n=1 Tax=Mucilaginibacter xinganensis TaxID=1234841 RepID=A0A223NWU0_9SPHI|nr:cadherin-like beta sandwich domain-containing protein [Mucilaginibacter xinganensis]ASU34286.1 Serine/threonine-protein kinase PknD [Mucilaginibacter xinganensis]
MKKIFTKVYYAAAVIILFLGATLSVNAQYTAKTLAANVWSSAVAKDGSGNVYVVEAITKNGFNDYAKVLKYTNGTGSPATIYTGNAIPFSNADGQTDDYAFGLAVTSNGDVYVTTTTNYTGTPAFYGNIIKLTNNSGTYAASTFFTGTADLAGFTSLAVDASDNLYCLRYHASSSAGPSGSYEVVEFPASGGVPSTSGATVIYNQLYLNALSSADGYSNITGLAIDPSGNIYVADAFDITSPATDGGHVYKLTKSGNTYTPSTFTTGKRTRALATDAAGNVYATNGTSAGSAYSLVEYAGGSNASPLTLYTNFGTDGNFYPFGIAALSSNNIFVADGSEGGGIDGSLVQLFGPASTAATGVSFSSIGATTATATWSANGNGTSRVAFIANASTGSPAPVNSTTYTANVNFGSGTQIASTGWYCIYNGTGSPANVNLTGLTAGQTYRVMVLEYNGVAGAENYLQTTGTNNPNNFTAQSPVAITSLARAGATPTNASSVSYTATFAGSITGLTASNFSLTTTGVSGASIGTVTGSGTTWTIPVSTGTGDGTIQLNLANATGVSPGITTSLPFAGEVYTIDKTPATLTSGSYFSNNGNSSQYAKVGDNITLSIGYNEVLQSLTMTIGGHAVSVTPSNGNKNWTGVYTETSGDTEGNVPWTLSATDLAGNIRNYSNTDFGTVLIFDKTPPAINIGAPTPAIAGNGAGNPVTYAVTYSDANFNYSTLSTGDITLNATGTATGTVSLSGSGQSYTVTVSNITGLGTLGISIAAGTAADIPGNISVAAGPSGTFNVVSADATLANLSTTAPGGFTPAFDAATTSYTAAVPNNTTTTTVTPTSTDAAATIQVRVNGGSYAAVSNGAASGALALNVGSNPIDVLVTAEDGATTKTYTITVTRAPSINALLSSLTFNPYLKAVTVSGPDYRDYISSVANSVSSITVKPVTQDPTATVTVNGTTVSSGTSSTPIALNIGANVITTVVTAQDGVTQNTYSITVTRQGDALLSSLKFSPPLTITPVSGPYFKNYVGSLNSSVSSVQVMPIAEDPTSTIKVNGVTVASGATSDPVALNMGANTINTVVTAADGVTTKTYSIVITRTYSTLLTSLKFNPYIKAVTVSGTNYKDYTANVSNAVSSVTVTPVAQDPSATITVNGTTVASGTASASIPLNVGDNTITTIVTAPDASGTRTYSIVITRGVNALLSSLTFSPRITTTTVSGPDYRDYTATVNNTVSSVTVTPVTQDATSTVTVNGTPVTSGTASSAISLNEGDNTITTVVTAKDNTTTNTYSTVITRLAPPVVASTYDATLVAVAPVRTPDIQVHQNVSPNGDGNGDVLKIDGITAYPENTLQIMSRSGALVYEAKGYDNATKAFDGHASTNGKLQEPGTYFYSLDYKVGKDVVHKTGFIVLKY